MADYEHEISPEHRACRKVVLDCFAQAEKVHRAYEEPWREQQTLYRTHRALIDYGRRANNRDVAAREIAHEWGAELAIPLIFSAIETIVPRALSSSPTMTVRPNRPSAAPASQAIKELLEQQQIDMDYDMKLLPTARRGFKHGLGVQKTYWKKTTRKVMREGKRRRLRGAKAELREIVTYDGPDVEDVDIFDFFWDPSARSVETARYLIHRTYRDFAYVKRMVESGGWLPLDLEAVAKTKGSSPGIHTTEYPLPFGISVDEKRAGRDYELLEYHDREHVYTILNRQFVAVCDITPFWHREMPFQIFRPTLAEGEFVGIGEIEPARHLQYELNTLRSQRRDNAAFVLDRVYAYWDGMVDPSTFKRGPGALIPTIGAPQEAVFPIPVEDLPSSSYREEDALKSDFDRLTGIDDSLAGAGQQETATGTQLVAQAANVRIAAKTKNLLNETIRPAARQILELNRQHITEARAIRIDDPEQPDGYRFAKIDPELLAADVDVTPDAGSTEPENVVQQRNDALTLFNQLNGNPGVKQDVLIKYLLDQHAIPDSAAWLAPPEPEVGDVLMAVAQKIAALGVPEDRVESFMQEVAAEIGEPPAEGEQTPESEPAQNGTAPPVPA